MQLSEMGVLGALSRVELAKLIGEADELLVKSGETLNVSDSVFFVVSGAVQLCSPGSPDREFLPLSTIGPGEIVGEWSLIPGYTNPPMAMAQSDTIGFSIPVTRWASLIARNPDLNQHFQRTVLLRLLETQRTLGRYKRHLDSYAGEIWPTDEVAKDLEVVAQEAAPAMDLVREPESQQSEPAPTPTLSKSTSSRLKWFGVITAAFGALAVVAAVLQGFQEAQTWVVVMILSWTAVNWYLNLIPEYVVALGACLLTVGIGLASAGETFSGFADPTWFLLLGAFGIGVAIQRTGLLYRAALHMLRRLPPTYTGQAIALALAGTILTPCLPSVQSRVSMAGLLARELSEAMRFGKQSKGSAGLAMSAFLGFGQMRFLFLNGSSYSLLAWGLLPVAVRQGASWAQWFWIALPIGALVLLSTHWVTVYSMFREPDAAVSQTVIDRQLAVLGKITGREKLALWVTLGVVAGFILQPLHRVDASWVSLVGFLVLVITGVLDKDMVISKIDWQYMLFYGSLAGLVTLISKSQLSQVLTDAITGHLGPTASSPATFLLGVALLTMLVRLVFQPGPALILVGVTTFPLSANLGFNPVITAVVAVAASCTWLVPQLLSSYTTLHATTEGRCFDHKQVHGLSLVHAAFTLAAVLCAMPYWRFFGFLQ